jgi:hypothetical protein
MLVFGRVHVGAQLVGGGPQGFFDVVEHGVEIGPGAETQHYSAAPAEATSSSGGKTSLQIAGKFLNPCK